MDDNNFKNICIVSMFFAFMTLGVCGFILNEQGIKYKDLQERYDNLSIQKVKYFKEGFNATLELSPNCVFTTNCSPNAECTLQMYVREVFVDINTSEVINQGNETLINAYTN
jgi:hypothetical protein